MSLDAANNLTIADFEDENLKIVPHVMDLPAFKLYQHQVKFFMSFSCFPISFANFLEVQVFVEAKLIT